ncbi:MAG: BREX-1 system adenine-specific DNA-methyltransferase PglX [Rhodoferax sp.]|nr:BREX-1 system adenine-specific DNA-methyltransferase PglX [Rhodoferax sp.]
MSNIDRLLANYCRQVRLPWSSHTSGKQRIWFAVYPPAEERRVRARVPQFEAATLEANHGWARIDLTNLLPQWIASHEYREGIFTEPEHFSANSELEDLAVEQVRQACTAADADARRRALDPDGLETLADADGIVCLSATKGEAPAAERLRLLLVQALGSFDLAALLASAGPGAKNKSKAETLDDWLRDEFFEQHCALFHHRPFLWHLWDGHKSGFSALLNYHKLDHANLEKLTYAYLGDWIRRQQAAVDAGEAGSDARLAAAKTLQARLKLILEGEPPFDLFVRWKPLSSQAIGWQPDQNDGVRLNIRPFMAQDIPGGKKGAGLLRSKPNIKWEKDRGKEPMRAKAEFPWFWGWDEATQNFAGVGKEPDGNRWNDCHYSIAFKQAAQAPRK